MSRGVSDGIRVWPVGSNSTSPRSSSSTSASRIGQALFEADSEDTERDVDHELDTRASACLIAITGHGPGIGPVVVSRVRQRCESAVM